MADGTGRDGFGSLCHAIALRTAHRIIMLPLCKGGRNDDEDPLYLLGCTYRGDAPTEDERSAPSSATQSPLICGLYVVVGSHSRSRFAFMRYARRTVHVEMKLAHLASPRTTRTHIYYICDAGKYAESSSYRGRIAAVEI